MFYLFDNKENLIDVIPKESIASAFQIDNLNNIMTVDISLKNSEYKKVSNAEYLGHFDYDNKDVFYMYKIINNDASNLSEIKGIHVLFDDLKVDGYIRDKRPQNQLASEALATILNGTRWEVGTVNTTSRATTNWYDKTRLDALSDFLEKWNVELKYRLTFDGRKITNRYVDIYDKIGYETGKRLVYGTNAITVKVEENKTNLYTALIGRGKGEEKQDEQGQSTGGYGRKIQFTDVSWSKSNGDPVDKPAGQEYVELPEATKIYGLANGKPRIRIAEFSDCTDPEELLTLTYSELINTSRPQITFESDVERIGKTNIGDTVNIIRRDLDMFYTARVFKIERNLLDDRYTKFLLGDYIPTSSEKQKNSYNKKLNSINSALNEFRSNVDKKVGNLLTSLQEGLTQSYFNEDGYNYEFKAGNEYNLPAGYYSFNKPIGDDPTSVIYVGAGKMAIANSKKSDGTWDWRTFGTGNGFVADVIVAGMLRGGNVKWNLNDGTFLIGESIDNYLLYFNGNALKWGPGSIDSSTLSNELKEELKGRDGKIKYNLVTHGDFSRVFGLKKFNNWETKLYNLWTTVSTDGSVELVENYSYLFLKIRCEARQRFYIKEKKKHFLRLKTKGKVQITVYECDKEERLISSVVYQTVESNDWISSDFSFNTTYSNSHHYRIDLIAQSEYAYIRSVLLLDEELSSADIWYPSIHDALGIQGEKGEKGEQGEPGTLAELPLALQFWGGKATEISGKYIFTPELFVGANLDSQYSRTGIYTGSGLKIKDVTGSWENIDGVTGIYQGSALWNIRPNGAGWIGRGNRAISWNTDGELRLPKVRAQEIETGAITTDILYPGEQNRIIMERGYGPGSNDCKSIDSNGDGIRFKYNAGNYLKVDSKGTSFLRNGTTQATIGGYYNGLSVKSGTIMCLENNEYSMNCREGSNFFVLTGGRQAIYADSGGVYAAAFVQTSDVRSKENVCLLDDSRLMLKNLVVKNEKLTSEEIIDFVRSTKFYTYNFRGLDKPKFSTLTQDVKNEKIKNVLVHKASGINKYDSLDLYSYISMLHLALQKEIERNDNLENRLKKLEDIIIKDDI